MAFEEFTTDEYVDQNNEVWFCIRVEKESRMQCGNKKGHYTVASFETFKHWGWKKRNGQ